MPLNFLIDPRRAESFPSPGSSSSSSVTSNSSSSRSCNRSPSYSQSTSGSSTSSDEESVLSSIIHCIHYKEGCTWSDELKKLKDHLNVCSYDVVECPSQCTAVIPRLGLDEHLRRSCAFRPVQCQSCHKTCIARDLPIHQRTCSSYRPTPAIRKKSSRGSECSNNCNININKNNSITETKRYVECSSCHRQIMSTLLQNHQIHCESSTNSLSPALSTHNPKKQDQSPSQQQRFALTSKENDQNIDGNFGNIKENDYSNILQITPCEFSEIGCKFNGQGRNLGAHLNDNEAEHVSLISSVASKQQQQITHLRKSLAKLTLNHTGTLIWRIKNFAAKLREAKGKEGTELISSAFYTGQYGYKIQASVFLNGNGVGEGSHLSVYIKILPGEYDAMVKWPFSYPVSFTLYDQNPDVEKILNIEESFNPDPNWINFKRPSREVDVLGFGFPRFVSHEMLKKRHYIVNDTIFLKIKVDTTRRATATS